MSDFDTIESHADIDESAFVKVVEAGQIGYRLAEEIRQLREELLVVKQEKRLMIVAKENAEEELAKSKAIIAELKSSLSEAIRSNKKQTNDYVKMNSVRNNLADQAKLWKNALSAEKRKCSLLGEELERSLLDEAALRSYCRRLEADTEVLKESLHKSEENLHLESVELHKCQKYIDLSLRSHLVIGKKLEAIAFVCDKDADFSSSVLDVSPDYIDTLFQDLKSGITNTEPLGHINSISSGRRVSFDYGLLEHKRTSSEHQINQYLSSIRHHVGKLRKVQNKHRKYLRSLLDVVKTYEDLSLDSAVAVFGSRTSINSEDVGLSTLNNVTTGDYVKRTSNPPDITRNSEDCNESYHPTSIDHNCASNHSNAVGQSVTSRTISLLEELEESLEK
mmetsp:Transcript_13013/g.21815  ORF Transcript_13013/g.21815 Transcript_13013/m.21815 type:complete len:392 (-) Transcript_13013:453-1628(-)|eukprot:CAMPEP_0175013472 /NCGR_PEP_ID=MMETSP0005-20121125/9937_1 /TAXON_ID=420556 /ORGANISM="Ochromonas sp., Strain CCMP1393" /LENGTH=391 /DNA_ID=CAMNT_0016269931 /DNA_START=138 /DNA_END=1313 /DNA_ORIENTATION=+